MLEYSGSQEIAAFRVWRSLVSRLNGVQEAPSSNLGTRTMKTERAFALSVFFLVRDSNEFRAAHRYAA